MKHSAFFSVALLAGALALAAPALAQDRDPVIDQARAQGLVGEQFDGYLGFVPGAQISADLRGRVEQVNIRRRALYTQRAEARNATVAEMATAVACEVIERGRIVPGEHYRDENGAWRQRGAAPVPLPRICTAPAAQ